MKRKLDPRLKLARVRLPGYPPGDDRNGAFEVSAPSGRRLLLIASDGENWEHVSVSVAGSLSATPTWGEMCFVKSLFWGPEEVVVQYHPAADRYVNVHEGCLHLWRPQTGNLPTPPLELV